MTTEPSGEASIPTHGDRRSSGSPAVGAQSQASLPADAPVASAAPSAAQQDVDQASITPAASRPTSVSGDTDQLEDEAAAGHRQEPQAAMGQLTYPAPDSLKTSESLQNPVWDGPAQDSRKQSPRVSQNDSLLEKETPRTVSVPGRKEDLDLLTPSDQVQLPQNVPAVSTADTDSQPDVRAAGPTSVPGDTDQLEDEAASGHRQEPQAAMGQLTYPAPDSLKTSESLQNPVWDGPAQDSRKQSPRVSQNDSLVETETSRTVSVPGRKEDLNLLTPSDQVQLPQNVPAVSTADTDSQPDVRAAGPTSVSGDTDQLEDEAASGHRQEPQAAMGQLTYPAPDSLKTSESLQNPVWDGPAQDSRKQSPRVSQNDSLLEKETPRTVSVPGRKEDLDLLTPSDQVQLPQNVPAVSTADTDSQPDVRAAGPTSVPGDTDQLEDEAASGHRQEPQAAMGQLTYPAPDSLKTSESLQNPVWDGPAQDSRKQSPRVSQNDSLVEKETSRTVSVPGRKEDLNLLTPSDQVQLPQNVPAVSTADTDSQPDVRAAGPTSVSGDTDQLEDEAASGHRQEPQAAMGQLTYPAPDSLKTSESLQNPVWDGPAQDSRKQSPRVSQNDSLLEKETPRTVSVPGRKEDLDLLTPSDQVQLPQNVPAVSTADTDSQPDVRAAGPTSVSGDTDQLEDEAASGHRQEPQAAMGQLTYPALDSLKTSESLQNPVWDGPAQDSRKQSPRVSQNDSLLEKETPRTVSVPGRKEDLNLLTPSDQVQLPQNVPAVSTADTDSQPDVRAAGTVAAAEKPEGPEALGPDTEVLPSAEPQVVTKEPSVDSSGDPQALPVAPYPEGSGPTLSGAPTTAPEWRPLDSSLYAAIEESSYMHSMTSLLTEGEASISPLADILVWPETSMDMATDLLAVGHSSAADLLHSAGPRLHSVSSLLHSARSAFSSRLVAGTGSVLRSVTHLLERMEQRTAEGICSAMRYLTSHLTPYHSGLSCD